MASRSALTEEGRTRIRNFSGRLNSYLVLWVLVGVIAVVLGIWVRTRYGYLPLQRLYLAQYIKATLKSFIPSSRQSNYTILVRVIDAKGNGDQVVGCTDEQVQPLRDGSGRVRFDPRFGPFFQLQPGIPHKYFYWRRAPQNDLETYLWFRNQIYLGKSLVGLYWVCFLPFPFILIGGMILSAKLDLRINREYEEGRLVRGIRLLSHKEYVSESKQIDGLGLPVLYPERRLR